MSRTKICIVLAEVRDRYFALQVNQRLYVNAAVTLAFSLVTLATLEPQSARGMLLIFLAFWVAAIGYDLLALYKKVYETVLGKSFLLLLFTLCTNFSIVLSSQLVNDVVGIDPTKFPHTIALLSILSIPIFIAAGFSILYFFLLLLTPLLIIFHTLPDDKAKEVLVPGHLAGSTTSYHKITRVVQLVSFAIFCGFVFTFSQRIIRSYETFLTDTARSFLYHMEMYPKAQCNIRSNSRAAFIGDERILLGEKNPTSIVFRVQECKSDA